MKLYQLKKLVKFDITAPYVSVQTVIMNQPANVMIPTGGENITVGEYIKTHPGNYTIPIPRGYETVVSTTPYTKEILSDAIIRKIYPFSMLSLFGASVISGFATSMVYLLKIPRKLIEKLTHSSS
ncbi:MAG: hypothetical protein QXU15_03280 [Candidatus Aenigmatarchaeota archaeon]